MTMVRDRIFKDCVFVISFCLVFSLFDSSRASEQTIYLHGERDSCDVGVSGDCFFYPIDKKPFSLEVWQWTGNTIKKAHKIPVDKTIMSAAILAPGIWVFDFCEPKILGGGEFSVVNANSGKTIYQWKDPSDWYVALDQASRNGKHVAMWSKPEGWRRGELRFGLLAPDGKSVNWTVDVNRGIITTAIPTLIQRVIPSDDGKYLGAIGWKMGLLMIDLSQKKAIWALSSEYKPGKWDASKRPKMPWKEIPFDDSFNDFAFTPDNKMIYTGGKKGFVYGIKTESGETVSKWRVTLPGLEDWPHRITSIAVSSDGKFVAVGLLSYGNALLYSTKDGHRYVLNHGRSMGIHLVSFSPDSKRLATYGEGEIKIWKLSEVIAESKSDKPETGKKTVK